MKKYSLWISLAAILVALYGIAALADPPNQNIGWNNSPSYKYKKIISGADGTKVFTLEADNTTDATIKYSELAAAIAGGPGGGGASFENMALVDPNQTEVAGEVYNTIQAALTYVATQSPSVANPWIIWVAEETYLENIVVPAMRGVSVLGLGRPTIQAVSPAAAALTELINTAVYFDSFTIWGAFDDGVNLVELGQSANTTTDIASFRNCAFYIYDFAATGANRLVNITGPSDYPQPYYFVFDQCYFQAISSGTVTGITCAANTGVTLKNTVMDNIAGGTDAIEMASGVAYLVSASFNGWTDKTVEGTGTVYWYNSMASSSGFAAGLTVAPGKGVFHDLTLGTATNYTYIPDNTCLSYAGANRPVARLYPLQTPSYSYDWGATSGHAVVIKSHSLYGHDPASTVARGNYIKAVGGDDAQSDALAWTVVLPQNFDGFATATPLHVYVYASDYTTNEIAITLRVNGALDATVTDLSVTPTANDEWQEKTSGLGGSYSAANAGQPCEVDVKFTVDNADELRVEGLRLDYYERY